MNESLHNKIKKHLHILMKIYLSELKRRMWGRVEMLLQNLLKSWNHGPWSNNFGGTEGIWQNSKCAVQCDSLAVSPSFSKCFGAEVLACLGPRGCAARRAPPPAPAVGQEVRALALPPTQGPLLSERRHVSVPPRRPQLLGQSHPKGR